MKRWRIKQGERAINHTLATIWIIQVNPVGSQYGWHDWEWCWTWEDAVDYLKELGW